jgi:hypothetical protein
MVRIKVVLAALALVVATFAAFAGPAMADTFGNDGQRFFVNNGNDGQRFFVNNGNNGFLFDNCGTVIGGILFDIAPFNDCGFDNNRNDGIFNGVFQEAG